MNTGRFDDSDTLTLDEQAKIAVDNGVELLNDYFGNDDWKMEVSRETLNMESAYRCTLAQIFGDFDAGMETLFPDYEAGRVVDNGDNRGFVYGFDSDISNLTYSFQYFDLLTAEWLTRL